MKRITRVLLSAMLAVFVCFAPTVAHASNLSHEGEVFIGEITTVSMVSDSEGNAETRGSVTGSMGTASIWQQGNSIRWSVQMSQSFGPLPSTERYQSTQLMTISLEHNEHKD